ncbi:MAG: 2-succinyl-5-enolpyruvyl-6-hydroxy-3-cyclohexene-1-carboxylic-acid synthase [Bdellovibrionales bacterium CG12_big_fil_rev_8_21_14_0_65_38_15]|nr:MAG: 2-succinyl-5-enolpyruvyl-6-hydroxy-3-cyclohexene-1-carboxylic-acid synthase [Bdellovibrionales bacterium CG22_combo_CG10-13_8_21_14_all_38_13]PIQ56376.1 MAG: 2-succinyl-5-enolpyruvyl-6-hydroxy-3-cyclohexene-1-carboxylic-acid synthase [Bdellovibrionales bacterium CG12_big_fil_rev_8_21_14_0_65_38_15]PIR29407.1 MAG: 2-succinyl-5-enolpyruvyl-6-hydroxy-3-cyclohexene-1-carboxylic-acid synthase [Bdellovibrionales bacterium CG11_big_fil_rev_8_21_14_0_20_38_13]
MSSALLTENKSRLWSSLIANQFKKLGASHVFIAPGMRNAPLIAGFQAQSDIELHVGMDERGLSYQALGYAKTSGKPAILVCTSGTAAANFYPAVIEASKSQVPLIVLSADRPLELSQSDANQSINQKNLYGQHCKHFLDLGSPNDDMNLKAIARMTAFAWEMAIKRPFGPVHINIAFREPLDGKETNLDSKYIQDAKTIVDQESPSRQLLGHLLQDISPILPFLQKSKKPLIVVGELSLCDVKDARSELIESLRSCPYPLNVDVTSSLKFDFSLEDGLIPTFDHPEVYEYFHQNPPDLVLHIGGRLTSKHYYRFLKDHSDQFPVIHLSQANQLSDSGFAVTHDLNVNPTLSILELSKYWKSQAPIKPSVFQSFIQKKINVIEGTDKVAFPYISKRVVEMIPQGSHLAIGNSTLIRSFDSYASLAKAKDLSVLTHRGASGIEGFFASSTGCALASSKPVTLVLGDVSAIHDLNSLELVSNSKTPVICIVVNNFGGGIFTLLNLEKGEQLYPIITSPHERKLAPMAQAFGLKTWQVSTRNEFEAAYIAALNHPTSSFIEVYVDTTANNKIYQELRTIKLS